MIFAVDVGVKDQNRFAGKPVIQSGTKRAINEPDVMVRETLAAADDPNSRRVAGDGSGADAIEDDPHRRRQLGLTQLGQAADEAQHADRVGATNHDDQIGVVEDGERCAVASGGDRVEGQLLIGLEAEPAVDHGEIGERAGRAEHGRDGARAQFRPA